MPGTEDSAVAVSPCLATFDRSIPLQAVKGATRANLAVIGQAQEALNLVSP
jgi:hypothetical protein